jgi:sulfatase modifying factor 1
VNRARTASRATVPRAIVLSYFGVALVGCHSPKFRGAHASASVSPVATTSSSPPPWDGGRRAPVVPDGMVWIPPGALVAGTPLGSLPRAADAEMAGEQVIMKGFFISIYPYPDEEAAIPLANVTLDQARALCEEREQRLCTELEWERACKGPDNHVYEYGDRYRADVCGTGGEPRMLPVGLRVACRSDFGVRDMHGSLWEWTSSAWGRGLRDNLVAVRGGNAPSGEAVGRCANGVPRSPAVKAASVGFRCCMGPENDARVSLHVERAAPLEPRELDPALARKLEAALPDEGRAELRRDDTFRITRAWTWHPIGNEALVVGSGCTAGTTSLRGCGVVVARMIGLEPAPLAWAGSGVYISTLRTENDPRYLWVYGGDAKSHFRRLLNYTWGLVATGGLDRNVKMPSARAAE